MNLPHQAAADVCRIMRVWRAHGVVRVPTEASPDKIDTFPAVMTKTQPTTCRQSISGLVGAYLPSCDAATSGIPIVHAWLNLLHCLSRPGSCCWRRRCRARRRFCLRGCAARDPRRATSCSARSRRPARTPRSQHGRCAASTDVPEYICSRLTPFRWCCCLVDRSRSLLLSRCEPRVRPSSKAGPAIRIRHLKRVTDSVYRLQCLLVQATLAAIEGRLQPLRQEAVSEAVSGWLALVAATVQVRRTYVVHLNKFHCGQHIHGAFTCLYGQFCGGSLLFLMEASCRLK